MKALLFIKREKEPIELNEQEGDSAEQMIANTNTPNETVFSIPKVWTGHKSDMNYVKWIKERVYNESEEDRPLTHQEKLNGDRIRKETSEWLKDRGIIK